jgi:hypothetical protein
MADHTKNALSAMSYTLEKIVAPAIDSNDPIAREQVQSAVRHLDFIIQRIDLLPARYRTELRHHVQLALAVRADASAVDPAVAESLWNATEEATAALDNPGVSVRVLLAATASLAGWLAELVRRSALTHDPDLHRRIALAIVVGSRQRTMFERAWYLPMGVDQSPDEVPPLDEVLDVGAVDPAAAVVVVN